jgi:rubrerythrin
VIHLAEWAQELIDRLSEHMDSERDALTAYQALVEQADDPRIRELAAQILDDEVRHHRRFDEIRAGLREEVEQRLPSASPTRLTDQQRGELLARTEQLLDLERDDVKELQQLAKRLRKVEDTAWRAGVVESMELDNRKHILLLEQIRSILKHG